MFYAHCQAPANFYDTLFLFRHTPLFRAGFSSASSRQAKHDRNSRTVGTPHYPRPFCIQSRHANSHRRHYSCMEGKSKYIPYGKRRIEGVRHEWRLLSCISIFSWNSGDIYEQAFVKTFVGFFTGIPNIHLARCALRPDLCYAPTSSIKNLRLLALISGSWH